MIDRVPGNGFHSVEETTGKDWLATGTQKSRSAARVATTDHAVK